MTFDAESADAFYARQDELVEAFGAWLGDRRRDVDPEDLALLLDWKWGYGDGRLDRWHVADLREFLLGWCPRKLSAPAELVHTVPSAVGLAMSFLSETGLLARDSAPVAQLSAYPLGLEGDFMREMANPANFGMAKSLFGQLGIEDQAPLDADQLTQAVNEWNLLPDDVRRTATDPFIAPSPAAELPRIGPVGLPSDEAVRASADAAPVLDGFSHLASYFAAPGRSLTSNGNLKLTDARALVSELQTGDVIDPKIGGRIFRTSSATELSGIDHWQWWARKAGALRKHGNKMVGVKAWQQRRTRDALGEVRRAFRVLVDTGVLASYSSYYYSNVAHFVDETLGPLLGRLLQEAPTASDYDLLLETCTELLTSFKAPESYPGELRRSFDQLVTLLERAGILTQEGASHTPHKYGGTERSGGTVALTPVGLVLAVEVLRGMGLTVDVVSRPETLDADDVVAHFDLGPDAWWSLAGTWLDAQRHAEQGLSELVSALGQVGPITVLTVLDEAPQSLYSRLQPVLTELALHTDPPPGDLGSMALHWLLDHDLVGLDDFDKDVILDSDLVLLGVLAEGDPSSVPDLIGRDRNASEQLELVASISRRLPPRAVILLDAIGSQHPNKVVAKAARKELFRVRSRLSAIGPD